MSPRRGPGVPLSVSPTVPFHEPDLTPEHKVAVIEALRWAWVELKREHPDVLLCGEEEAITDKLQELLNKRTGRERIASWLKDFETVTRGESQRTADSRIGKKPDLTFRPPTYMAVTDTTRWGWFVECKIIKGSASVKAYRDKGVYRFSSGEYAAWMPSGAMLAYVRDDLTPMSALDQSLQENVGTKRHMPGPTPDLSESEHDRSSLSTPCTDVILTHIWLRVE